MISCHGNPASIHCFFDSIEAKHWFLASRVSRSEGEALWSLAAGVELPVIHIALILCWFKLFIQIRIEWWDLVLHDLHFVI